MAERIISERIAEFCVNAKYDDIPLPIIEKTKRHILDTFGAGLAGSLSDEQQKVVKVLKELGRDSGCAPLWGAGQCINPLDAALSNGIAAHTFELDDTGGCDHSGAVVLPTAVACLSLCDRRVGGKEFITAIVLGYDIARRALEACGAYEPHNEAGWHSTSTCGTFGAAVTAGYLLQLTEAQMQSALGLASSASGGLWAFIHDGAQSKRLHPGRAAEGGLLAALLARQGFSGPKMIFEDVWGGFTRTFAPNSEDRDAWLREIGFNWKMGRVSIKPYTSCRSTHAAMDAVRILKKQHNFQSTDIAGIDVAVNSFVHGMCGGRDTGAMPAAQMSMVYGMAAILAYGAAGLDAYTKERRTHKVVQEMMDKIVLMIDETMPADEEPIVTVNLKSGECYQLQVEIPLGSPQNPLSDAQLLEKYKAITALVWPKQESDKLAKLTLLLEQLDDMQEIVRLLQTKPRENLTVIA